MKHRPLFASSVHQHRRWGGLFALLLVASHAHAQWQVTDRVTHEGLDQANKRIEEVRDQQAIGSAKRSTDGASEKPDDPKLTLEQEQMGKSPQATIQSARTPNEVIKLRCDKEPDTDKVLLHDRWTVCSEIVKTEVAQYNYALAMREVSIQRQTRLEKIEEARRGLNSGYQDAGRLQSNSNELLALLARMEADKQQYRTYMDAYASRVSYLRALHESLGQRAVNGSSPSLGQAALGAASLGALKVALDAQKTTPRSSR